MRKSIVLAVLLAGAALVAQQTGVFSVMKSTTPLGKQAAGFFLLPTNQMLRPWGEQTVIPGRPVDMAFDSQKRVLAVLNTRSILLMDGSTGSKLAEVASKATSYAGIAFQPGNRELWASEATRNGPDSIFIVQMSELGMPGATSRIELKGHPVPVGIAFSADGRRAYVAFSRSNSLAVIDTETHEIIKEVEVGMAPFGVVVSKERGRIYVSNRGGRRPKAGDTVAPSAGSEIVTDPVTGSSSSGTLSVIDARTLEAKEVAVGLAPSDLALSPDEKLLAVSNSHSDTVSILDTATLARKDVKVPAFPDAALGSQPSSSVFAPEGKTLFVACGGNNAIAVLKASGENWKAVGAVPTAWFPSAIAIDAAGALRVLNIKGVGDTANNRGTFNSTQYKGSLEMIPALTPLQVESGTREVRAANMPVYEAAGGIKNLPSLGIEHVFLIVKENRTYDQVFGDIAKANGDPKLVMYGKDITPNHHALAERYVVLDNFYAGGAISFDGHQWLEQGFVSDYTERAFASSPRGYAWNMSDALVVAPTGFFWQAATKPLDVRIYGEFQLAAKWDPEKRIAQDMDEKDDLSWSDYWKLYKEGKWQSAVGARSGVPALQKYSSQRYPYSTLAIPDQIRAEEFLRELAEHEASGKLANLSILTLNQDHTNGTRPTVPKPAAMVADNDLALGRIVEGISKSRFWSKSLILVVEDDAQNGVDHVDGHRTVALAIGPYVRRNAVDSNNYNHTSMIRTIQEIFRIPQRTRFLVAARAMTSVFTAEADVKPYQHLVPSVAPDEMNPPLKALAGERLWAAKESMKMNFKDIDDAPPETLNRILWWEAKGSDHPYPARK
ncbi:MAG TPA: bifunctional YncE family protein/alkaline phosphatase family protein [Candidatus Sulfopaludibacter sp.]|jgi:YVTN family beta-propeller protein|nr:bifunctional YncE family protein/alkaline phosphatase family protein [Candidatus Sulfopaludibacter sp.]